MLTSKENYLLAAHGEKPEWVPSFTEETNMYKLPIWNVDPETGADFCNIKWVSDDFGKMPDPNWRALETISDWREVVKFPDLRALDWDQLVDDFHGGSYDPDKVDIFMANTWGIFLAPINMMGWEDGLCALYEEPDDMKEFISTFTDYLCESIELAGKYFHPDIVFSGDDIAGGGGPFVSKEIWNAFYKPYFAKIADTIHAQGALAEFHCCGDNDFFIEEIINIGYDICQLPVPNVNLIRDKKRFGKRLVLTGGWARHSDAGLPGASEDTVRASVREAIDTFGANGGLIFWDGGIVGKDDDAKNKMRWVLDELHAYGKKVYA